MLDAGKQFAERLATADVVILHGELGAGKTLFCKGVLAGLGYSGDVPSPTYTITQHYAPPDVRLAVVHADLYRLNNPDEIEELGLFDSDAILLVEWAGQGGNAFADARFDVRIDRISETQRELTIKEKT
jgi:tRNA threonylcarbamoyladenosine biosynthesis protein TsaE